MKPIIPVCPGFELPVTVYAKDPQYLQLPCYKDEDGTVMTRWKLTFKERIKILLYGNLWLTVLTFNKSLQPINLTVDCPIDTGFNSQT
jgi:hypothetical protein